MKACRSCILLLVLFFFHFSGKAQRLEYAYWETYGQYVPLAVAEFGGCVGLDAHDTFWLRSFKIGTAFVSEFIIVKSLKSVIDEERPDGRSNNSFPSGHTATAFNGAELVRYEYGTWWGVGAYTLATAVGLSRVYHKRHYIWDVGAGALCGVLSARIGIQTVSKIKEKRDSKIEDISFSPVFSTNNIGFNLSMSF